MKIRLGYACVSETLNITSSTPYSYTSFKKENDYDKLDKIIKSNLHDLYEILKYHYKILNALNIQNKILVLHIGSSTFGKEKSIQRFIYHFKHLDEDIKKCIAIENDDKAFNILDCLNISKKLNIPIVLDYHHHYCNNDNINLMDYIDEIFSTWKKQNPKIHFSSPKNKIKKEMRSHHDYIDSNTFIEFIDSIKHLPYDIDIMIEAKKKDEALFKLVRELKYKTNYIFWDDTSFIVK